MSIYKYTLARSWQDLAEIIFVRDIEQYFHERI